MTSIKRVDLEEKELNECQVCSHDDHDAGKLKMGKRQGNLTEQEQKTSKKIKHMSHNVIGMSKNI